MPKITAITAAFRWAGSRCKAVYARCRAALGRSPYGHLPRQRMRVLGPDGKPVGDSRDSIAYVSRHGLLGPGITCPVCGRLAARAGDWSKIAETSWGEAVLCSCKRMLLASPDDDIDPVKPSERYDQDVYHKFARPAQWEKPMPTTLAREPAVGDRVLVIDGPLANAEGNVLEITSGDDGSPTPAQIATVSIPVGWAAGDRIEKFQLSLLKVLALPTLRRGDDVRIARGPHAPANGVITGIDMAKEHARMWVRVGDATYSVEIEHLDKIHEPSPT